MEELLRLLENFREHLSTQMELFSELLPVLDQEEAMMATFDVSRFEKIVVTKDQLVQRASRVEDRRVICLRRICFLIGYDARGETLPSLTEFTSILLNYEKNVQALLPADVVLQLAETCSAISELAKHYLSSFRAAAPRIQRNQTVLSRLAKSFELSLNLLRSDQKSSDGYNSHGKTKNLFERPDGKSSVRVSV